MEPFIPLVIPFVRPQFAHAINVQPIPHTASAVMHIRISCQHILLYLIKANFLKMLIGMPLPNNIAFPIYFQKNIIAKIFIADLLVHKILMAQNQCGTAVGFALHLRHIISHRISFPLKIMMLSGHPLRLLSYIFNKFMLIKLPNYIAVPIHLHHVSHILVAVFIAAFSQRAQYIPALQQFVGKTS